MEEGPSEEQRASIPSKRPNFEKRRTTLPASHKGENDPSLSLQKWAFRRNKASQHRQEPKIKKIA